jgi:AraC-like DNA-binding protein
MRVTANLREEDVFLLHNGCVEETAANRMKLYIKYMVSLRCKMVVREELRKLGLVHAIVELGVVETIGDVTESQRQELKTALIMSGLELMDDRKSLLIEKIRHLIIEMIHYADEMPRINYSEYISEKLGCDYTYLSSIFSEVKGITIQQYVIFHKIERAKELLIYDELTLEEIAHKLNYSSAAHLSNQFKKVTGQTPSFFRKLKQKRNDNQVNL